MKKRMTLLAALAIVSSPVLAEGIPVEPGMWEVTTTMTVQRKLVEAIRLADLPSRPGVLVGGAPTSPAWAREIGAFHAENAMSAVAMAGQMLDA